MEGFQLWLNLPARDKMCAPWYRDFQAADIPAFTTAQGVSVRVLAGESQGVHGAMRRETTEPLYLDLDMPANAAFAQPLPPAHNAFVYVYRGVLRVAGTEIPVQRMAILDNDPAADGVLLEATEPTRALLVAGRPLGEPIVQHGPFVMTTQDEIVRAVQDYQAGRFGAG